LRIARRTLLAQIAGAAGCATAPPLTLSAAQPSERGEASALERFGITWTFDRAYPIGRYAQGDWWVAGPVRITGIDPPSERGARARNGAMVNPEPGSAAQGYDSAMYGRRAEGRYRDALNVALGVSAASPLELPPGSSLVSTVSDREPGAEPQLRTSAVLTVVDAPPPAVSFRPPYCGADKSARWSASALRTELLGELRAARGAPSFGALEERFERPWLDHVGGWLAGYHHPADNMPTYGREIAIAVGDAALALNTDAPAARKERLLRRFVQLGIDLYGVAENGGGWPPDGGHASGRKLPILFAGLMLGDERMLNIGRSEVLFGEDGQTFYVTETTPGVINGGHGNYRREHVGMPEWGIRHAEAPARDDAAWDARYRSCCTANAWVGIVLAAHAMGLRALWGHDALFDYQDRYMAESHAEPWLRSRSSWAGAMWDMHRADYPPVWGG
jgi:hypothetical protein